jgi:hypothetical protein
MYPHERSLVKRLENRPFALIGVNSDMDRDDLKKVLKKEQITWRSFWNGGNTSGPISSAWKVQTWPTLYIIDCTGTIRFRDVRAEAMDSLVDALLEEMDNTQK